MEAWQNCCQPLKQGACLQQIQSCMAVIHVTCLEVILPVSETWCWQLSSCVLSLCTTEAMMSSQHWRQRATSLMVTSWAYEVKCTVPQPCHAEALHEGAPRNQLGGLLPIAMNIRGAMQHAAHWRQPEATALQVSAATELRAAGATAHPLSVTK